MNVKTQGKGQPIDKILRPFQEFVNAEVSGGIILVLTVILALLIANSPFKGDYFSLWQEKISISFGSVFYLSKALILWINDGLMALFFLLVGLEIKREVLVGELSSFKKALLPAVAALGGMFFPALIFLFFNYNSQWLSAWAIPMATDIAFSLGILILVGKRVPTSLKLFLVSFAIVDDIGAVIIIALFYTEKVFLDYLVLALILLFLLIGYNLLGGKSLLVYFVVGILIWLFILKSGLHATLAGILVALTIPASKKIDIKDFTLQAKYFLDSLTFENSDSYVEEEIHHSGLKQLEELCGQTETPLQRLEHGLAPWVSFIIVPLFAFANAGVDLSLLGNSISIQDLFFHPVFLGIFFGLILGKSIGITLFVYISERLKIIKLPNQVTMIHVIGISVLAGVGFTMSHFIASLTFTSPDQEVVLNLARFVILLASAISGIIGYLILYSSEGLNKRFESKKITSS